MRAKDEVVAEKAASGGDKAKDDEASTAPLHEKVRLSTSTSLLLPCRPWTELTLSEGMCSVKSEAPLSTLSNASWAKEVSVRSTLDDGVRQQLQRMVSTPIRSGLAQSLHLCQHS